MNIHYKEPGDKPDGRSTRCREPRLNPLLDARRLNFLQHFDKDDRNRVTSWALAPLRRYQLDAPHRVLDGLRWYIRDRGYAQEHPELIAQLTSISEAAALAWAGWLLEWDSLPKQTKNYFKGQKYLALKARGEVK